MISLATQDSNFIVFIGIFAIIALIGGIISLIGAIYFLIGRKEFGEKHHKNVNLAVIIFVITIVFTIFFTIVVSAALYFSISSSISQIDSSPYSIILMIQSIVSAILVGLVYYFGLIELEDELGKKMLFTGIISSICISFINSIYYFGLFGEISESISSNGGSSIMNLNQNIGGMSIIGVIPSIFYIIAMYIPYARIKEGKLIAHLLSSDGSGQPVRNCPNCNREIPFDSIICPYCGKNF